MEWTSKGIILSNRPLGETAAVVILLSEAHGKHAGVVHGAYSSRTRWVIEPGNLVSCHWRAASAEQLGNYKLESLRGYAAPLLDQPDRLAALAAVCAILDACLAERESHPGLYNATLVLLELLEGPVWAETLVQWELGLLAELGFALDLSVCAVTGARDGEGNHTLTHVSPRTGRAVSAAAAQPYLDRLLPLPGFLIGRDSGGPEGIHQGLQLTGHFLERHALHGPLPAARQRLAERCAKAAGRE